MSSLYNKDYLSTIDSNYVSSFFNGTKDFLIDPKDKKSIHNYVVIQHYLVAYIEKYGKTDIANKILKKYYDDFIQYPHLFVESPLIKNGFLDRFMPENFRTKAKKYRDEYYNDDAALNIYYKYMKNIDITEKEQDRLFSYLTHQLYTNNPKYNKAYENCIKKILSSGKPIKDLNDTELKFYCKYVAKFAGKDHKINPEVYIMSREPNNGGYQSNGAVYINKDSNFTPTIEEVTQTICHEVRHAVQFKMSKEKENKTAFEYARYSLFNKYLKTEDYDIYHKNYRYSDIELDAENSGYFDSKVFLRMFNRSDLADKINERKQRLYDTRHYYEYMVSKENKPIPADNFVVDYMDEIISKNPNELKNYKVLNRLYNESGERKKFSRIIVNRMRQKIDDRGLYDSYVNYGIARDELDKLDLQTAGKDNCRELFTALGSIYRDKALLFKDYCEDKTYQNYNKGQVEKTTSYQLELLNKIINYIDKNMDYVLESNNEDKLTNRSFIFDFIYDFRDFDFNSINNEVLKNSPLIQEKVDKLLNTSKSVIKKFNRQYIKDRIKDLSTEELNKMIKSPEGVNISLNDYLFLDLLPRLDGHMEVPYNGRKLYVGDIINLYKNQVKKVNDIGNMK